MEESVKNQGDFEVHEIVSLLKRHAESYAVLLKGWRTFGRILGLDEVQILSLNHEITSGRLELREAPREMLGIWKARMGATATLKALTTALIQTGNHHLAEVINQQLGLPSPKWMRFTLQGKEFTVENNHNVRDHVLKLIQSLEKDECVMTDPPGCSKSSEILPELIKKELTIRDEAKYYISRTLLKTSRLNPDIFSHRDTEEHVFVLAGLKLYEVSQICKKYDTKDISSTQTVVVTAKFIVLEIESDYERICSLTNKPVHFIKYKNNKYIWKKSNKNVRVIHEHLDEKYTVQINEEKLINKIQGATRPKAFVFSDSPGMGKTYLLAHFAKRMNETCSDTLTFYIELQALMQNIDSIQSSLAPLECIAKYCCAHADYTNILGEILKTSPIDLFLDGYDEVVKNKEEIANTFLKCLKSLKNVKLFVATRPHFTDKLLQILEVGSYEIKPFSEENQVHFLIKYWTHENKAVYNNELHTYAKECLNDLQEKMTDIEREIAGIPLQCMMLAEVCAEEAKRASISGLGIKVKFDSVFDMYRVLVKRKFDKILQEKPNPGSQYTNVRKNYLNAHVADAIKLLFPHLFDKLLDLLKGHMEVKEDTMYSIGLTEKSPSLGVRRFVHRTFAEYLIAEFLVKHMCISLNAMQIVFGFIFGCPGTSIMNHETVPRYVLDHIAIAYFFEHHLKNYLRYNSIDYTLFDGYVQLCFIKVEDICSAIYACCSQGLEKSFEFFRTILLNSGRHAQLCDQSYLKNLPNFAIESSNSLTFLQDVLNLLEDHFYINVFNDFDVVSEEYQAKLEYPRITHCSLLHEAVYHGRNNITIYLVDRYGKEKVMSFRYLLHVCVYNSASNSSSAIEEKLDIIELLHSLKKTWFTKKYDYSPILQPNVHFKILQLLVQLGADINVSSESKTFLHTSKPESIIEYNCLLEWAVSNAHTKFNILNKGQIFVQEVADVIIKYKTFQKKTLDLFVRAGANLNYHDQDGNSVLAHVLNACLQVKACSVSIVHEMFKKGADVNHVNKCQENILHIVMKQAKQLNSSMEMVVNILKQLDVCDFNGVNDADADGCVALVSALKLKDINNQLLEEFLNLGADFSLIYKCPESRRLLNRLQDHLVTYIAHMAGKD